MRWLWRWIKRAFLAVAVTIQQTSGGTLAEILDGLAKVIRGRFRLFRLVRAITAEAKWSGMFLSVFPIVALVAIVRTVVRVMNSSDDSKPPACAGCPQAPAPPKGEMSIGKVENAGFLDYRIPVASDLPMIDTVILEIPNPGHPYGVRGVGETPIVPPLAAVTNAVAAATGGGGDPYIGYLLAREAMRDVSFHLRPAHLEKVAAILDDPEASDNDRFVALELLKNANISSSRVLPTCQDTGTALVMAKKGQQVWTGCNDAEQLSAGIAAAYTEENLALLDTGIANLAAHIQNARQFGMPVVVAINRFLNDTDAEVDLVKKRALEAGALAAEATSHWADGGEGAVALAEAVVAACPSGVT